MAKMYNFTHPAYLALSLAAANEFAEFVARNICIGPLMQIETHVAHQGEQPFYGLLVSARPDEDALQGELEYLLEVFRRDDLITLTEAARVAGVSIQAVKARVRNFSNPTAVNPQRGATLVSEADVRAAYL